MLKLISHIIVLLIGASLGVWWGVYHPAQATNLVAQDQGQGGVAAETQWESVEGKYPAEPGC
jgi:hypothetical protein